MLCVKVSLPHDPPHPNKSRYAHAHRPGCIHSQTGSLLIQVFEWINTAVSGQGVLIWGPADWFDWENRCERNEDVKWNLTNQASTPTQNSSLATRATLYIFNFFALLAKLFRGWLCQPRCWMRRAVSCNGLWGRELWKIDEGGGRKQSSPVGCSSHQNHAHGVGVTRAWTPAGQHDDNVSLFEEASGFAWKLHMTHLIKYCNHYFLFCFLTVVLTKYLFRSDIFESM